MKGLWDIFQFMAIAVVFTVPAAGMILLIKRNVMFIYRGIYLSVAGDVYFMAVFCAAHHIL
ncbi:MAG: hypothetical protein HQK56_20740, partial [Deltaproteobacteria bacterium]|nr:hypothetical protein [Deltaproteobacteria bacterium]